MAITFQAVSSNALGQTSILVPYPTVSGGILAGDRLVIVGGAHPITASFATPSGWAALGSLTGGNNVAAAADVGQSYVAAFDKTAAGGETGTVTVTVTGGVATASGTGAWATMYCYRNATGLWSTAAATADDATTGTAWSATFSSNPGITSGDHLIAAVATSTDTQPTWASDVITATGATIAALAVDTVPASTSGLDVGGALRRTSCTAGTASAAPVHTATLSGTTTNWSGPEILIRLRETAAGTTFAITAAASTTPSAAAALTITTAGTGPTNSFEGGTNTTAVTTGNSGGASGTAFDLVTVTTSGTVAFDSTTAAHGGMALLVATGTTAGESYVSWITGLTASSVPTVYLRTYIYLTANPGTQSRLFRWLDTASNTVRASLMISTAGKLVLTDSSGTQQGISTASLPLNQWVRVEAACTGNASTGSLTARLYTSMDSTTIAETVSASSINTGGTVDRVRIGMSGTAVASVTYRLDDLGGSVTNWMGPAAAGATTHAATGAASTTPVAAGSLTLRGAVTAAASTSPVAAGSLTVVTGGTTLAVTGAATATPVVAAALILTGAVTGASSATSSAAAALTRVTSVTAAASTTPAAAGSLTIVTGGVTLAVTGAASTTPAAAGSVTLTGAVTGAASTTATSSAALTRVTPVTGLATTVPVTAAALTITSGAITWQITAAAVTTPAAAGSVTATLAVSGTATTAPSASAAIVLRAVLTAQASTTVSASASLGIRYPLSGQAATIASAAATLGLLLRITAAASTTPVAQALLSLIVPGAPGIPGKTTSTSTAPSVTGRERAPALAGASRATAVVTSAAGASLTSTSRAPAAAGSVWP